jgi:DNA polymerase-3 subunit epsilon
MAASSSSPDPPSGPWWEVPISVAPLAFIDLEMNGLDTERHRVIELCIERVAGEHVERLSTLVRPSDLALDRPLGNARFHGIAPSELVDAPSFSALVERVVGLLADSVLVGHGARWDIAFLTAELARAGVAWSCTHYLDTLRLSRRLRSAPSHRLQALARDLGIENPRPHRSDNDVSVLRALFEKLCAEIDAPAGPDGPGLTPRLLWDLCHQKRSVKPGVIAAAERSVMLGQPARVCYRPSGRPAQELLFQATAVRTDLDPPVVLGYLQPTRSRRELRADRILTFETLEHEPP